MCVCVCVCMFPHGLCLLVGFVVVVCLFVLSFYDDWRVYVNKLRAIYYHLALCLVLGHRVVLLLNGTVRIKK